MDHCYSYVSSDDEFKKLVVRMNPPCVRIENKDAKKHTLIVVDSANKRGCLLQVLEVLSDLNLIVKKAYISSDGGWFMDVFHVTDELGNKVYDAAIAERIEKVLKPKEKPKEQAEENPRKPPPPPPPPPRTTIELSGRDRPGLLSEVFAVLKDQKCNIVSADAWTYGWRMSSIICITDEGSGVAIQDDEERLDNIKQLLIYLLKGGSVSTVVTDGDLDIIINAQRRLHQMMLAELVVDHDDSTEDAGSSDEGAAVVSIQDITDRGYTFVTVVCPDRPKLVFDTVCTITDMQYVVFHGTIYADQGPVAEQEYFIRHVDGTPITSDPEKKRLIHCIQAAIRRRPTQGIRVDSVAEDRVGLLSDVTRVLRENGLTVSRAEAVTRGTQAVNAFYVTDASSGCNPVKMETIEEAVIKEMGTNVVLLRVKEETYPQQQKNRHRGFSLRSIFRSS